MSPAPQVSDIFQLEGTTLEGRFVIDRVVAEGGFGVVYHGRQVALDRPIALKVLKTPARFNEEAKQEFLASFASEAKTVARIAHPNIVMVHDFGVSSMPSGGRAAWMAMEWLTGITLEAELLRRRGKGGRSPAECLALLQPILSALAVVHAEGVAHRDVKPANIMLVPTPAGAVMKLLDFGLAKLMEEDESPGTGHTRSRSSQVAFSPGYAAPEQISHGRSGPWTDVHALGLILTEMLTDRPPLDGEDLPLLFQQIVHPVRPTPAKRGVTVGPWEYVLTRALAVSSAERYRDARDLQRALESTATAASEVHVSIPDDVRLAAGLAPSPGSRDTLAIMSTQMDPALSGSAHTGSPITTSGRKSDAVPFARTPWARAVPVAVLSAVGLLGWLAWHMLQPAPAPSPSQALAITRVGDATPAPSSPPLVPASAAPLSATPSLAPSPSPSASPPLASAAPSSMAPAPSHGAKRPSPPRPSSASSVPPPSPAPSPPPSASPPPAHSGDIVIE